MKLLYIQKKKMDEDMKEIIDELQSKLEVTTIDLNIEKDYMKIVELIDSSDKIISW